MRIAIQTLVGEINYGCMLQAYALQTILQRMGHKVVIINRRENSHSIQSYIYRVLSFLKCLYRIYVLRDEKYVLCNPFNYYYVVERSKLIDFSLMQQFVDEYLNLSPLFRSSKSLTTYAEEQNFDCYIVGSDQVWREAYVSNIYDSFLGYLPENNNSIKITYAASFGISEKPISLDKVECCAHLARRFNAISVREKIGKKLVKEMFGLNSTYVIDPTLLLNKDDYESVIGDGHLGKDKIVTYILDKSLEKEKISKIMSESLNCDEFHLTNYPLNEDNIKQAYSVEQWLEAISNAKFVITDSFHGCVYSILFEKPFLVIANDNRGSERFISLLESLDLSDRIVYNFNGFIRQKERFMDIIDYEVILGKLDELRKNSLSYLLKYLEPLRHTV